VWWVVQNVPPGFFIRPILCCALNVLGCSLFLKSKFTNLLAKNQESITYKLNLPELKFFIFCSVTKVLETSESTLRPRGVQSQS
jgi:hypothetical protein